MSSRLLRIIDESLIKSLITTRKLPDAVKRDVRENIAAKLAAGELTLGEAVRLMRLAAGKTQAQYARMVNIDIRVLADIEKGQGNPRLDTLEKLAKPYGLMVSFVRPQKNDGV